MNKYLEREPGKLPSLEFSDGLTLHALEIRAKPFASQACHKLIPEGRIRNPVRCKSFSPGEDPG